MHKIVRAHVENVRGCTLADASLNESSLTVIGGANGAGKSSFIDGIQWALTGQKSMPPQPINEKEDSAEIRLKVTGKEGSLLPWPCEIVRTIEHEPTGGWRTKLRITSEDGDNAPTPQTILNSIYQASNFDPLQFIQMDPKQQANLLKELAGLDFSELDHERQAAYDERTRINRNAKQIDGMIKKLPLHVDVPEEPISLRELTSELSIKDRANQSKQYAKINLDDCRRELGRLNQRLREIKDEIESKEKDCEKWEEEFESLESHDLEPIRQKIESAEDVNAKVAENKKRLDRIADKQKLERESRTLTLKIKNIDADKQDKAAKAKWPIKGLGFGLAGVTFDGRPIEQLSSAEQMEVAVAIAVEQNPEFPFVIIRNGSLLDDKHLQELREIVEAKGAQCLVERVSQGSECHIVFEEGVAHVRD